MGLEPRRRPLEPGYGFPFLFTPPPILMTEDKSWLARCTLPYLLALVLLYDHGLLTSSPAESTLTGILAIGSSALAASTCVVGRSSAAVSELYKGCGNPV